MMIFKLINTPNNIDNITDLEINPIRNLINSVREKKHIVICDKSFAELLSTCGDFDRVIRSTAKNIEMQQRECKSLLNKVNFYIEIDYSNAVSAHKSMVGITTILTLPLSYFSDSARCQKTKLLGENSNDCLLFNIIAKTYQIKNDISNLSCSLEMVNGGGNTTKAVFDNIVANGDFCLCLLDSDQKYPSSAYGSTYSIFERDPQPNNGKYMNIEAHEAECLLPLGIIEEIIANGRTLGGVVDNIDDLKEICRQDINAKLYFDHKNGLSIKYIEELSERNQSNYWKDLYTRAEHIRKRGCQINIECTHDTSCFALKGLGSDLLTKGISALKEKSIHKIIETLNPPLDQLWDKLGKEIFSWGCAPSVKERAS